MLQRIATTLLLLGALLSASDIGININDDDAEFHAAFDLNPAFYIQSTTRYDIHASLLHANDNLIKLGFSATNSIEGANSFTVGVGIDAVIGDDFVATPLFLKLSWMLPLDEPVPQTTFSFYGAYAPSVLSFSDADNYREIRLEADSEVIDHVHLYVGYRNIDTDYETYDYNFNDSWYGGVRFSF